MLESCASLFESCARGYPLRAHHGKMAFEADITEADFLRDSDFLARYDGPRRVYASPWAASQLRSSSLSVTQWPLTGSGFVKLSGS